MSETLNRFREKYPAYDDKPDDELVVKIGDKYPVYLKQDKDFKAEYDKAKAPPPPTLWHQMVDTGSKAAGSVWEFLKGGMPHSEEEYAGMAVANPFTKEGNIPGLQAAHDILSQLPPAKTAAGRTAQSLLKSGVDLTMGATSRSMAPLAVIPGADLGGVLGLETLTKLGFGAWMVKEGIEAPPKIKKILDRPGPMTDADKQEISDELHSAGIGVYMGGRLLGEGVSESIKGLKDLAPITATVVRGPFGSSLKQPAPRGVPTGTGVAPGKFVGAETKATVPTGETEEGLTEKIGMIQAAGARTKEDIQSLRDEKGELVFPAISRERAAALRDMAWGPQVKLAIKDPVHQRVWLAEPDEVKQEVARAKETVDDANMARLLREAKDRLAAKGFGIEKAAEKPKAPAPREKPSVKSAPIQHAPPSDRRREIFSKIENYQPLTEQDRADWVAAGGDPALLPAAGAPPQPMSDEEKKRVEQRVTFKVETGKRLTAKDRADWLAAGLDERRLPAKKNQPKKGAPSASQVSQTAEVHGNVPAQPGEGLREVPQQTGGEGVRPQGAQEGQQAQQVLTGFTRRAIKNKSDAQAMAVLDKGEVVPDPQHEGYWAVKAGKAPQPSTGEPSPSAVPEAAAPQGSGKTGAAPAAPEPPPIIEPNTKSPFPQDADFTLTKEDAAKKGLIGFVGDYFKRGGKWYRVNTQGETELIGDKGRVAEALEATLPNPHDFRPAFNQAEGEPIVGDKGTFHDAIINKAKTDPEWLVANIDRLQTGRGFWYEPPGEKGRFVTRGEASHMLQLKEPLHSEKLADLQAATREAAPPPDVAEQAKAIKNRLSYNRAQALYAQMKGGDAPHEFVSGNKPTDELNAMHAAFKAGAIKSGRALQRWIADYWKQQEAQAAKPEMKLEKDNGGTMAVQVSEHPVDPNLWQPRGPAGVAFQSQEAAENYLKAQADKAPAGNEKVMISKGEDGKWRIFGEKKAGARRPARGGELQMTIFPGLKEFVDQEIGPAWESFTKMLGETKNGLENLFNAANKSDEAKVAAGALREGAAKMAQKQFQLRKEFGKALKQFDKLDPDRSLDFINRMETRQAQPTPELQALADKLRNLFADYARRIRALPHPKGSGGFLQNLVQNYFPHIWKDPDAAASWYARIMGKRPLRGPASFLKRRSFPLTADGIAAGLEPVTYNPIELSLMKAHEMERFIFGQQIFQYLKDKGIAQFSRSEIPPDGFARIDDRIGNVIEYRPTEKADGTPGAPEKILHGHWYVQEDAARALNNYLSPGLSNYSWYRALRWAGNNLNMAQLGFSGFHFTFTMIDTGTSKTALGIQQIFQREFGKGAINIARGMLGTPIGANQLEAYLKGNKLLKEYYKPGSVGGDYGDILEGLLGGGGRVAMPQQFKNNAIQGMAKAFRQGNYIGGIMRAPFAALEGFSSILMQHVVPRLKLGVFVDMARNEIEQMDPGTTPEEFRARMGAVWDSVDNRLGEMVYDNLFWNRTLKDLSFATTRAVGWNLGTLRELGGGLVDSTTFIGRLQRGEPIFTRRMAYFAALPFTVGLMGAAYMYLRSRKLPEEMRDYYFPKTGETMPDGTEERVNFPSYLKDLSSIRRHPLVTIGHKLHPTLATIADMLQNKDFYGTQIVNPNDPLVKKVGEEMKFLAEQAIPFSARAAKRRVGADKSIEPKAEAFMGIMPMPSELARTPAENVIMQSAIRKMPQGGTTQAEQMRHELSKETEALLQKPSDYRKTVEKLRADEKAGKLTPTQMRYRQEKAAFERNQMNRGKTKGQAEFLWRFEHLDLEEAKEVWAVARPEEKALYKQSFNKKLRKAREPQVK